MHPDDPRFVDSPYGNSQSLTQSGMAPVHRSSKSFGRVPSYLKRYWAEQREEERRWEEERRREEARLEAMRLSDEERAGILEGLRANWSELHHAYQRLSLLTDTLPKKLRREQAEAQLDELERLIALVEKHTVILVSDDPYFSI